MKSKFHRLSLIFLLFFAVALCIISIVQAIFDFINLPSRSGVFECIIIIITNFMLFLIALLAEILTIRGYKKGSKFLKEFSLGYYLEIKKKNHVVYIILTIVFFILSIIFLLMYFDIIYNPVFPKGLSFGALALNYLLFVLFLSLATYPAFNLAELKANKIKKNK